MKRKPIKTTHTCTLATDASGAVPTDICIFPPSPAFTNDGRGPFHYDPATLIAAFEAMGGPQALDYEHQLDDGQVRTGPVPAAAYYLTQYYDPATGMRSKVEWTDTCDALIREKAYRNFSPSFEIIPDDATGNSGEVVCIFGGSVVQRPAFGQALQFASRGDAGAVATRSTDTQNPEPISMKQLLATLGLAEDATEDAAIAAVQSLQTTAVEVASVVTELAAEAQTSAAIVTAAQKKFTTDLTGYVAKADHEAVVTQLASLQQFNADAAVEAAIVATEKTGVVLTSEQRTAFKSIGAASLTTLTTALAALKPQIIPGEAANPTTATASQDEKFHGLTAGEQAQARRNGVTFKAYAATLKQLAAKAAKTA